MIAISLGFFCCIYWGWILLSNRNPPGMDVVLPVLPEVVGHSGIITLGESALVSVAGG